MANSKWTLDLLPDETPIVPEPPPPGALATYEERQIANALQVSLAEEGAKAWETHVVGRAVDVLNTHNAEAGVEMIEHYVDLSHQPRHPSAQELVDDYLGRELKRGLQDRRTTTNIGIGAMQNTQRRSFKPAPKPAKRWWEL